ncbi:hypothetical protein Q5P01_022971 [Channa striata]|uniref:Uncharacterized protein n=1 Tax=Channa striata TaxID=64152 RepID=A0AA88RWF5_CHASR|nr:hypothetical protein Q5P01_022971 [Channa striata]
MVLRVDDSSDPITQETTNAVLHTKMKTYFYAGFTSKTLESCELHNTKAQREPEKAPCPTETSAQSPAQETETLVGVYPEQAKENHFLLLMNGIRVVFTKTLAFNTLLTIRSLLF